MIRRGETSGHWLWLALSVLVIWGAPGRGATPYQPVFSDPLLEPWRWQTYPQLSGLDARCIAEGDDRTLWFGSPNDIWSYNGIEWVRHFNREGFLAGVATMCPTGDGGMYVGGRWWIGRYAGDKWSLLFPTPRQPFGEIRKLMVGHDHSLWAATSWGALHYQASQWTLFTGPEIASQLQTNQTGLQVHVELLPETATAKVRTNAPPTPRYDFYDICEDQRGRIWLGTDQGEVLCYEPAPPPASPKVPAGRSAGKWSVYNERDGMFCGRHPSLLASQDRTIWVVYGAGSGYANIFDGSAWSAVRLADLGVPGDCGGILQTRDGAVWLSCRSVLAVHRGGHWRTYEKPSVPIPTALNFLLQASDGALWIGGPGIEVQRVDYQSPRWLTLQDLNFQWESPAGAQWFLHRSGRVVVHDASQWISYGVEDGLIDAPVALLGTRNGEVWAAGSHGQTAATARFDGRTWTRFIHDDLSWGVDWRGVLESADGSVWFSAAVDSTDLAKRRAGILQFHNGEWTHHHQPGRAPRAGGDEDPATLLPATQRPEPVGKFNCLGESSDGKIWAGRNLLIFRENNKWSVFFPPPSVRSTLGEIMADPQTIGTMETMFVSRERALWIGTRAYGALRYDGHDWMWFGSRENLMANSVRSFAQTADGSIWAATDRGFSHFDGRTWSTALLPSQMTVPHEGGSIKAANSGKLWINRFAPDWTRRAWPKARPVDTTNCEFWTVCHQFQRTPPKTTLAAGAKQVSQPGNVSVFWSAASPWREASYDQFQFSYRLDQAPWSVYGSERGHAFFTLPVGSHRLEVRARDGDFNEDPSPATLEFVVLPTVWRQGWFIALMLVSAGLIVGQSLRVFLERSRLRKANRSLAGEIQERKRTEQELRRFDRALHMLSDSNQTLIRATDETTLLNEICQITVKVGGYRLAWVGLAEQDEAKTLRPAASAGFDSGYLESAKVTWADTERGRGPGGSAVRTGRTCVVRNIPNDPAFAPWREQALQRRYQSIIALPLASNGLTFGVLGIYAIEPDAFDPNEVKILEELAGDLAFGITTLRVRLERKKMMEALHERERHSQSLLRLSKNLERAQTYSEALEAARSEVHTIMGYQNLWVYLMAADNQCFKALAAGGPVAALVMLETGTATLPIQGDQMLEEIAASRDIVMVADARTDPRTNKKIVAQLGNRTIVNVPIFLLDRRLGSIGTGTFGDEGIRLPTGSEAEFLRAVASHMAVTLDRIHLLGQSQLAEKDRLARLWFVESLDRINLAVQGTNDLQQMMSAALDTVLTIFGCDRAFLLHPCDPEADSWTSPMERTRPEYPGVLTLGHVVPMNATVAESFRILLGSDEPVQFGPGTAHPIPADGVAERYGFKSFMSMALRPKVGPAWEFGIHQCSRPRVWTPEEERLFQEIGRRLTDGLTSLSSHRELQESEARFRLIAENTADTITTLDLNLRQTYVSPSIKTLRGYTPQEALDQTLDLILAPESFERAKKLFAEQMALEAGGKADPSRSVYLEVEEYCKNGSTIWVGLSASFLRDGNAKPIGILTVTRNITERKRAEDLLHAREEAFRALVENAPDAIVRYDRDGRRTYVNPVFEQLAGRPACELIGKTPVEAFVGNVEAGAKTFAALQRVLREKVSVEIVASWKDASGSLRSVQNRFAPEFGRDGSVAGVLSIARDITALKRTEESLRKLSRAVEQSPASIVITDLAGNIEYVNPRFTEVTGYTEADVLGQNPRVLKSGEAPPELYRQMWETIAGGKEWRGEFHNRKKNGELYWELASISPILDAAGTITHFLAVKEDITERKKLEAEFRQAQKMDAFGQLAGGVAHDFNNILTAIRGNVTLLEMGGASPAEQSDLLSEIAQATERAAGLTRQLLMFSRRQAVQLADLDLNEVVSNMTKMLQRLIGEHITLVAQYAPGGAPIHADPGMMEQILMNLAVNSRDAMPNGGKLGIQTENLLLDEDAARENPRRRPGRFVRLSVTDDGCGIRPGDLPHIFEPFFTTKDVGKGTGLGLATVFGIVAQHQGWIEVESQVGRGTTFRLYLPFTKPSTDVQAEKKKRRPERGGTETILLVEDEEAVRLLAKRILQQRGYRVLEAVSGRDALSLWAEHQAEIDLVLTDMVMPEGISGRELGKQLQADKPGLKIIYTSGYTDEMLGEAASLRGTPGFLEKPYDYSKILRKIRACLDTP